MVGIIVLLVVIIGAVVVFNSNPIKKYLLYVNHNQHDKAEQIFENKISGNDDLEQELEETLKGKLDNIYSQFKNEKVSYDDALNQISAYKEYDISKKYAASIEKKIKALNKSREAYEEAEKENNNGNIETAIKKYKLVIEEDSHYTDAQNKISQLAGAYQEELLSEAADLAQNKQYKEAIANVDKVISLVGESDELTDLEQQYTEMQSEQYVKVVMTNKTVTPENIDDWIFSNYVDFVFDVTNNCDKSIQGIEGRITFYDLFGKEILSSGCDFTGHIIEPGETYTESDLSLECNQFMDSHTKLYNTDYNDLKYSYEITSIVFTDGTTITPD
jgi:tetratricopeptide (TPR) repeat protein